MSYTLDDLHGFHTFLYVDKKLDSEMTVSYTLLETNTFHNQFAIMPHDVQRAMSTEIMRLKDNPYDEAFCEDLIGDLEGVWRIHVGRINNILYCVAYVGCEDCQERNLETKIGCLECYKYYWYHVKLVLCGRRDEFYEDLKSCWQSWIITANLIDQQE
jgi:hypothetical protein